MPLNNIVNDRDAPLLTSPPAQFSYTQKGTLTLGQYIFSPTRALVTGAKNVNAITAYRIKALSFSADIPKIAYQQALKLSTGDTDVPIFNMFMQSDANSPLFQDPVVCQDYFMDQEFRMIKIPNQKKNRFTAFFKGTLRQTAALTGFNEVNLTMQIWVQYIDNVNFIQALKQNFQKIKGSVV